jgi:carboxymethylenebutenolidase
MAHETITLQASDGACTVHVFTPQGQGPWPAVIVYMDGLGLRPALEDVAQRIADHGYLVLLPDMFHRYGAYGPLVPKLVFAGDASTTLKPLMASTDNLRAAQDTGAFLAYLETRADVAGERIGTVGFCMGGGMAIAAAGAWPDRVAAVASFHGGNLATELPTSPHLFAPRIRAELYIAVADNDRSYPPDMAARFEQALSDAGVRHRSELYPGAAHGWMKPDFPVYDREAAERGWGAMFELFDRVLRNGGSA